MADLTREEMETAFVQSAQDRIDGIWNVFTDDPYWERRLVERGAIEVTDMATNLSGKWFRIEHRQLSVRSRGKKAMSAKHLAALNGGNDG